MSFRKRATKPQPGTATASGTNESVPALPPGVHTSTNSGAPVTSWGLHAIDIALGGGLPLGSLTVVIEDEPSTYHVPLCSYVTAQGIHSGHAVAVASFDRPAEELVNNLPAHVERNMPSDGPTPRTSDERRNVAQMEIAWRYQKNADPSLHIVSGEGMRSFAFDFDLSQTAELPKNAAVSRIGRGVSSSMDEVIEHLHAHLKMAAKRKLLSRIVVHGLSTSFVEDGKNPTLAVSKFLSRIRGFTRIFGAVAVVSCTKDIPHRTASVASDALVRIDSFGGRGAGIAGLGKEWLGVLIVNKTFRESRGLSLRGKGDVWVFKRGRRKYVMERATAAPDDEDMSTAVLEGKGKSVSNESSAKKAGEGMQAGMLCGAKTSTSGFEF